MHSIAQESKTNHCYEVKAALRRSGLPFELRAVIREMAELADWNTGRTEHVKISQDDLASALGCCCRTLRRYQNAIKALPGKPWVTWKRTAGPTGKGRGIDDYAVHIGDVISAEEAKRITLSGRTQADRSMDPSGQIDGPKRTTVSDPLVTSSLDQIERQQADALTKFSSKKKKQITSEKKPTATLPPSDLMTNPAYLALGDARGLDRHVTLTELKKLGEHDATRSRSDWNFRIGQWLDLAVVHQQRAKNSNYIGAAPVPVRTEAEKAKIVSDRDAAVERSNAIQRAKLHSIASPDEVNEIFEAAARKKALVDLVSVTTVSKVVNQ